MRSRARETALRGAGSRPTRCFVRPTSVQGGAARPSEYFGCNVFSYDVMGQRLPAKDVAFLREQATHDVAIGPELAEKVALAAKDWAVSRGATHYCHWFQPQTGTTAEKHDAFLSFDENGRPIDQLTGKQLIQSEPDASSFPSGGQRSTFEARGYTAWDASSPMFLMETDNGLTLCIPSVFLSYTGEPLDEKTPLLRSLKELSRVACESLRLLGEKNVRYVTVGCGPEQEYFVVDEAFYHLRPDLVLAGRTLLGRTPPKGQQMEDHYFGSIRPRILAFMMECEHELYKLGVPCKTRHNEVAPCQFEIAPVYEVANVAADHNQLVMEVLRSVARRHALVALFHEKPFAGINGSGKHVNWSLADSLGHNLLEPGANPQANVRFLFFLAAAVKALHEHGALLRMAVATAGNEFRLGANEAPPAIMSVFLGEGLSAVLDRLTGQNGTGEKLKSDRINLDLAKVPVIHRDTTDRNRTSPFAFTGNKFEFRAVGASATISPAITALNVAVIAALRDMNRELTQRAAGRDVTLEMILSLVRDVVVATSAVRFEGNNYGEEWHQEAARRGLPNLRTTPEALAVLADERRHQPYVQARVLSSGECAARYHVRLEHYCKTRLIELETLSEMLSTHVLPSAIADQEALARSVGAMNAATGKQSRRQQDRLESLTGLIDKLLSDIDALNHLVASTRSMELETQASLIAERAVPLMSVARETSDALEARLDDALWSLPKYREILHVY